MRSRLVLLLLAAAMLAALGLLVFRAPAPVASAPPGNVSRDALPAADAGPGAVPEPAPPAAAPAPPPIAAAPAPTPDVPVPPPGVPAPAPPPAAASPVAGAAEAPAKKPAAPPAGAASDAGSPPPVSLEKLLTLSAPPAVSEEIGQDRNPHLRRGEPSGADAAGAGAEERLRVESREEQLGPGGQTSVKRTDASLGVPVGDAVDLRGGVEVERSRAAGAEPDTRAQPKVGFEVRF